MDLILCGECKLVQAFDTVSNGMRMISKRFSFSVHLFISKVMHNYYISNT